MVIHPQIGVYSHRMHTFLFYSISRSLDTILTLRIQTQYLFTIVFLKFEQICITTLSKIYWMYGSVHSDQIPHSAAFDLGLQ